MCSVKHSLYRFYHGKANHLMLHLALNVINWHVLEDNLLDPHVNQQNILRRKEVTNRN
jgi:hypothetical protein